MIGISGVKVDGTVVDSFLRRAQDHDRTPRLLIDGNCHVLWSSPDADGLLQAPLPLSIKGGRLQASSSASARTLGSYIENLCDEVERLFLAGKGGGTWALLSGWAERHRGDRVIFLQCVISWPLIDVESSGLAADFGLTRSECAVLDQFAHLRKPNDIAERLGISVSTVRSHLKQIHTKMSVNSSVQLLRITRAYCG